MATVPIALTPTDVGLTEAFNAQQNGLSVEFTHIAVGSGAWEPDNTTTALMAEAERVPITAGQLTPPNHLHLSALIDGEHEYWINEIGIIGNGSVLMAVWSHPTIPLCYKSQGVSLLLSHNYILHAYPPEVITVNNPSPNLNLTLVSEMAAFATAIIKINTREVRDMQKYIDLRDRIAALEAAQP